MNLLLMRCSHKSFSLRRVSFTSDFYCFPFDEKFSANEIILIGGASTWVHRSKSGSEHETHTVAVFLPFFKIVFNDTKTFSKRRQN